MTMWIHNIRAHTVVSACCSLAIAVAAGCSPDSGQAKPRKRANGGVERTSVGAIITPAKTAYKVDAIASPASIVGTVEGGESPSRGAGDVVLWISDIHQGKPFPVDRRFELTTHDSAFEPRVQAVVVGSTVNVHNDDGTPEVTRMIRLDTGDTLTSITLLDDGGVVPTDRIARNPGIVQLRSATHPSSDGYVAVFDQPYFAVTQANGSFRIDSLPPGRYTLMAWQERMPRPVAQQVDVAAGKETKVTIKLPVTDR